MNNLAPGLTAQPARRLRSLLIGSAVALVIVGGCSDSGSGGAETSPSTVVATTEVAPTSEVATTTTAAPVLVVPTVAPPTIPAPAPAFLRPDGLDTFDFGVPAAVVIAGIPLSITSDRNAEFPVAEGDFFFAADDSEYFITQVGRELCFADGNAGTLCSYFAGVNLDSLVFVGWQYSAPAGVDGTLFAASGITLNILASSVPAISLEGYGACFDFTSVPVDGILVDLTSSSGGFGDGIPADTRVTGMAAGSAILSLADTGDC